MGANPVDGLIAQAEALRTAGRAQESERAFRAALQLDSKNFAAWLGLSRLARQVGRIDQAINCLSHAYAINPSAGLEVKLEKLTKKLGARERAGLYRKIALLQADLGNVVAALGSVRKALRVDPKDTEAQFYFSRFLLDVRFTSKVDPALRADLTNALMSDGADKQYLVHAAISALRQEQAFNDLSQCMLGQGKEGDIESVDPAVLCDRLLVGLLRGALVTDRKMELLLTAVRRYLLGKMVESICASTSTSLGCDDFIAALAAQCFANEYIFGVTDQESSWLEVLVDQVAGRDAEVLPGAWLAMIGAYLPLVQLHNAVALSERRWQEPWDSLVQQQIRDLVVEDSIKETLGVTAEIREGVSKSVREQYEENPFPRWVDLPRVAQEESLQAHVRNLFPVAKVVGSGRNDPDILVAGCGTGLIPALYARKYPQARILAVDLSRSSLAYGKRKADQLGLSNIEFLQGDILILGVLERRFDLVNCYGVLHHTADIVESWRVLCGLLKPDGIMQIGLYSKIARQAVVMVRDYIAGKGCPSTLEGLRECRQDLMASGDPRWAPIINSWSFYSASNFRDLAFHVHEICITIPQLKQMLDELGLSFIGFELDYPETRPLYRREFPDDPAMTSLDNWCEFENRHPSTFENCYKFWVRRTE
jgi:SAM-dependent methyltransferase/tetratricopeptide (TPR) repeat protein